MANIAVLASGSGTNFQAIAEALPAAGHKISCIVYDRKKAYVKKRADKLSIPAHYIAYVNKTKEEAEKEIKTVVSLYKPDYIVLAGYMRLFTSYFVSEFRNKIVNIHPSLLPKYPGIHGIEDSYNSGDEKVGISIHFIDEGMDTGPIIIQKSFTRSGNESLKEVEKKIHALEHKWYPETIISLLNSL